MSDDDENAAMAAAPAKSKALPILLVINTLLLTGVLIFVIKRPSAHASADAKPGASAPAEHGAEGEKAPSAHGPEDSTALGPTVRFDNFTVQLKSADVDRYAHIAIEVEVTDEGAKSMVEKRVAPIRDAILGYISDRTPDELRGSDGLKEIKEALVKRLDELIPGHRIRAIYMTDFIIQ